ncbi:DUF2939 domain-containing protein [Caulobacter sp. S45]|uniref:DUF2939 domain-containing protein n=1 Tax=Caulobacter sp. S45 TaxID=1641861 RepID=UPI0020C6BB3E|nr:DUF2939 domain-containing protein [Caulobacter sp. S45]
MRLLRRLAAPALLAIALGGCATVPKFEAAGDIHAFLVAIRDGDQQTFDAHVDRPALKAQLKSRLIAEQAQTHGNASWQALGAVLAGPLVDVGVDALVQPQTFRAVAIRVGYSPDQPLPNRLQIDAFLHAIGDGSVCVVTRHEGPCTLVFHDEDGVWRLVGYEGDLGRLNRGKLG